MHLPPGYRQVATYLPLALVEVVDRKARSSGVSRAALLRQVLAAAHGFELDSEPSGEQS